MAIVSFLTKGQLLGEAFRPRIQSYDPKKPKSFPDLLTLDCTITETPTYETEPTDHPIESGSEISDHARIKPTKLAIEGIMSDTPLTLQNQAAGLVATTAASQFKGGFKGAESAIIGVVTGKIASSLFANSPSPLQIARDQLRTIVLSRTLVRIVTKYEVFDNMLIYNLSFTRSTDTGLSLKFSFQAKKILIVTARTVKLDNLASEVAHSAGEKAKLGKRGSEDANAQQTRRSSVLFSLGSRFGIGGS